MVTFDKNSYLETPIIQAGYDHKDLSSGQRGLQVSISIIKGVVVACNHKNTWFKKNC